MAGPGCVSRLDLPLSLARCGSSPQGSTGLIPHPMPAVLVSAGHCHCPGTPHGRGIPTDVDERCGAEQVCPTGLLHHRASAAPTSCATVHGSGKLWGQPRAMSHGSQPPAQEQFVLLVGSTRGFAWRVLVCLWKRGGFALACMRLLGLCGAPCAHPSLQHGLKLVLCMVGTTPRYLSVAGSKSLKPTLFLLHKKNKLSWVSVSKIPVPPGHFLPFLIIFLFYFHLYFCCSFYSRFSAFNSLSSLAFILLFTLYALKSFHRFFFSFWV